MLSRIEAPTLVLHDITAPSTGYSVQEIKGLSEPVTRISSYDKPGEDGGVVASLLYGARLVTLSGRIDGVDSTTFENRRLAFVSATAPTRDSLGRPELVRFTLTTLSGATYYIEGVVRKQLVDVQENTFAKFLLEIICPDGQVFGTATVTSGAISRPATSGAPFPWTFDPTIEFGATTGGTVTLENVGSAGVWPIITLSGVMTNPTIYHEESGTTMQLNVTLGAADEVVIDMKEHSIVLNDTTNYLGYKTGDSDWFGIEPGTNVVRFNTGGTSDTGTMEINFNPAYLAI